MGNDERDINEGYERKSWGGWIEGRKGILWVNFDDGLGGWNGWDLEKNYMEGGWNVGGGGGGSGSGGVYVGFVIVRGWVVFIYLEGVGGEWWGVWGWIVCDLVGGLLWGGGFFVCFGGGRGGWWRLGVRGGRGGGRGLVGGGGGGCGGWGEGGGSRWGGWFWGVGGGGFWEGGGIGIGVWRVEGVFYGIFGLGVYLGGWVGLKLMWRGVGGYCGLSGVGKVVGGWVYWCGVVFGDEREGLIVLCGGMGG
uniref:Uncharacterized protein n=1 Tax=Knipowitschia caucasica TaxID=637954 RepID=A0AAV2LT83_KNICA